MVSFPATGTVGLDFQARLTLPQYPSASWSVTAVLRGPVALDLPFSPDVDGIAHDLAVSAAETAKWTAGDYWYSLRAASNGSVFEVGSGSVAIKPDFAAIASPYDGRSDNEKALEAIEAVLGKRATLDQERYRIGERELWRTSMSDLLKLRTFYAERVRRERLRAQGKRTTFGRAIRVNFQ
ncbi:hypothetical protein AB4Y36_10250 [Paraburkholderia sp. BR10936]|uniref:hypothetical protein n=1 Tax=Paraburkholderia sp. BR10936 TaxID=3236993 RepID=UPI0034D2A67F